MGKWLGKDTFAATGKKLCTYQPVLPIRWLMDNVDGIESQVNSGDILFGTIDCWLIWKLTEGAVHAVASSNASSLGCYDLKEKKWYQPIFDHLKVPVSIFPEVLDDAADYGTTNLFGSPIPITGAIADQQSALFSENCHQAGSAKCTNGTGTFMDINATILIMTPLLLPVAQTYGIDPIHFGAIMLVNMCVGFLTPPFAVGIFVSTKIAHSTFGDTVREAVPFIGVGLIAIVITTFCPEYINFFVNLFS